MTSRIRPKGIPSLAHSELVIFNLLADMILGILPGISIPPLTRSPIRIPSICRPLIEGLISAAARVALSRTAKKNG
jgi:hypothetical protein